MHQTRMRKLSDPSQTRPPPPTMTRPQPPLPLQLATSFCSTSHAKKSRASLSSAIPNETCLKTSKYDFFFSFILVQVIILIQISFKILCYLHYILAVWSCHSLTLEYIHHCYRCMFVFVDLVFFAAYFIFDLFFFVFPFFLNIKSILSNLN